MVAAAITYKYLPKQLQFFQNCDEIPYSAYIGGFGSGKTHCLVLQILRESSRPSLGLVGAPTYRMLADTTQRKFFELCPPSWIQVFVKSENRVVLTNGTEILFRSLEAPEKLRNLGLSWFALDEIGDCELETYRMLQGRLRLPESSLHGCCVGNPQGPAHWTYTYFVENQNPSYRLVQAASYENTFLPKQYLHEMETSFGKGSLYYKRFVLGLFVASEGAIWPNFSPLPYPGGHIIPPDKLFSHVRPLRFFKVIDFGIVHPFACLWFVTDGEKIVCFDEYFASHQPILQHCLSIQQHEKEHDIKYGAHDHSIAYTDHDAVARTEIEYCTDENDVPVGFTCIPAEKKVLQGIILVSTLLERKVLLFTENCKKTIKQIASYHAKPPEKSAGHEVPVKKDDDACDCVRMGCVMETPRATDFIRVPMSYAAQDIFEGAIT